MELSRWNAAESHHLSHPEDADLALEALLAYWAWLATVRP